MDNFLPDELKIAREASITMGGSAVGGILRYFFNIFVARFLGVEILGFYAIGNAVTQVASVVGKLGLDLGVVRFVSRLRALDRIPEATATIRLAIKYGLFNGLLIGLILIANAGRMSVSLFHAQSDFPGQLFVWFFATIPLMVLAQIAVGGSQAFKVLKHRALALDVLPAIFLCVILLGLAGWAGSLWSLAAAFVGSQVVSVLAAFYFLTRLVPVHRPVSAAPEAGLLRFSLPLVLAAVMSMLIHWSDILMLGALTDGQTVGLYQPAARTAGMMLLFTASFSWILAPMVSDLDARQQNTRIHSLLKLAARWNFSFTWPAFLFLWLYASKVMLVFGADFLPGRIVLQILALAQVILSLAAGNAFVLTMTGYPKAALVNNTLTLTVNVLANLYLIPRYGILGAALGTLAAVGTLTLLRMAEVWVLYRMHPMTWNHVKPLLAGGAAFAVCMAANRFIFDWHTIIVLLLGAAIFLAVYAGATYLLGLSQDDLSVLRAIRRKLERGLR